MMKRRIVALLQARTDSTRLPKKVLKELLGKPMIIQELIRIKRSKLIDKLVLVTSEEANDDELANIVADSGFSVFRGSKDNVLERFYKCAEELALSSDDVIVRLTGDCPVHDATIIDELIQAFLETEVDYMANCVLPVYPDGLDAEVFTFKSLSEAYLRVSKTSEYEHVTPFIRENELFTTLDLQKTPIHPNWRLTVDEPEDFTLIERVYKHFNSNEFTFLDMQTYLETHPELLSINSHISRNEGYRKSLQKEADLQGERYVQEDADNRFDRNPGHLHNTFTEYLISLFSKQDFRNFKVAEFGVGRANNISLLSHFADQVDGYDGSKRSIEMLKTLQQRNPKVDGLRVNLGSKFNALNSYDLIVYGFFTYMINDEEFSKLVANSCRFLNNDGYIYIYDFLSETNKSTVDSHNPEMKVYKRNLKFYTEKFKDFQLIDFRLFDNRHLHEYLYKDNVHSIDTNISHDDYNWTFSALFKIK